MPLAVDRVAERVQPAQGIDLDFVAVDEHHARRADRRRQHAATDDAVAHGAGRAVAGSADDDALGRQAEQLGRLGRKLAGHLFGFVKIAQQAAVKSSRSSSSLDQRRFFTSSSSMPLASLMSEA